MGGSDIYVAERLKSGAWHVENLQAVNTSANDYEADISRDGRQLAVISDRGGTSRVHLFRQHDGDWIHRGRIHARAGVFQVGPLWSPDGGRLMFSQATPASSGEMFVVDLAQDSNPSWPPACAVAPRP